MELCEILGITINEFFLGEQIENKDFKQKADENLLKALENSTFNLDEKIKYYRKKWQREHFGELNIGLIVSLVLIYIFFDTEDVLFLVIIGTFIWSIIEIKKKITYIDNHLYKKEK